MGVPNTHAKSLAAPPGVSVPVRFPPTFQVADYRQVLHRIRESAKTRPGAVLGLSCGAVGGWLVGWSGGGWCGKADAILVGDTWGLGGKKEEGGYVVYGIYGSLLWGNEITWETSGVDSRVG